jgi:hypothetical protein
VKNWLRSVACSPVRRVPIADYERVLAGRITQRRSTQIIHYGVWLTPRASAHASYIALADSRAQLAGDSASRMASNMPPAAGPVSDNGDQGHGFETSGAYPANGGYSTFTNVMSPGAHCRMGIALLTGLLAILLCR